MMKNTKQNRWLIICVAVGLLFSAETYSFFSRGVVVPGMIFGVFALIFFLFAYAYGSGKLK
jgi:hypothetical protein